MSYLTQFRHSGELEVLHALCNVYCRNKTAFSYVGMYARTQLGVMDHNSDTERKQAVTTEGKPRYKTLYTKISAAWVAKAIMEDKKKKYMNDIVSTIWEVSRLNIHGSTSRLNIHGPTLENVPKNIATEEYPGRSV